MSESKIEGDFEVVEDVYSDFGSGPGGWNSIRGNWKAAAGKYTASGNTRGGRWLAHYTEPIFIGGKTSTFYDTREYHTTVSLGCKNERCAAGLAPMLMEQGTEPGGKVYYSWLEITVSGTNRLSVRLFSEYPSRKWVRTIIDRLDVAGAIKDKSSFRLSAVVRPNANVSVAGYFIVAIDNKIVACRNGEVPYPIGGQAGLVFFSQQESDSASFDEVSVQPTRYELDGQWCKYPLP